MASTKNVVSAQHYYFQPQHLWVTSAGKATTHFFMCLA